MKHDSYATLRDNGFVTSILSKLDLCLTVPEEVILQQGARGEELFFISIGDCIVNQVDQSRVQHALIRLLTEGDHFGEICLLYRCPRTCSVISRNYNTMARLLHQGFRSVINQYPEYRKMLIKSITKYQDTRTLFLKKLIQNLDYTFGLQDEVIYTMMFALGQERYHNQDIVLRIGDRCTELIFVEFGICEIYVDFEGNEFVLERLTQGHIINSRSFFFEDTMQVNIRCSGPVNLLKISLAQFEEVCATNPALNTNVLKYQQWVLKQDKKFPLDCIACNNDHDSHHAQKS